MVTCIPFRANSLESIPSSIASVVFQQKFNLNFDDTVVSKATALSGGNMNMACTFFEITPYESLKGVTKTMCCGATGRLVRQAWCASGGIVSDGRHTLTGCFAPVDISSAGNATDGTHTWQPGPITRIAP